MINGNSISLLPELQLSPELQQIKDIAQHIFNQLGSSHSEYIYQRCMEFELRNNNIIYETEKRLAIMYTDTMGTSYTIGEERIDIFIHKIGDSTIPILIELKAVVNEPKQTEVAQITKYYRELLKIDIQIKYGVIINFPQAGTKKNRSLIDFKLIEF
uniref:GxxExxY protein n=1 Tax=viral metagenome TaxID=1070528 RepID=A0A6C0J9M0_9ZZZZ